MSSDSMSSNATSSPPAPGSQYREAIASYRTSVKWVVSSFGAVAAALVVGIQLTSLGELHGEKLHWAFLSVAVVFAAILGIIMAAVRCLSPIGGTYAGFKNDRDFAALRSFLKEDDKPLRNTAKTAGELADKYDQAIEEENTKWTAYLADKASETLESEYVDAKTARANLFQVVQAVTALGLFLRTKQLFRQTMLTVYAGVALAAAGSVAFAYLANPPAPAKPTPTASVHVAVNEPQTCVDLYLALDKLARDAPRIGKHWPTSSLGAQDRACGFHNEKELARFLSLLAHR